ncbi:GH1 family beta-glucosidase [Roseibium sp. AS2]|uniref:GH1 family beta-glucosidase n=1 Tax=Roseibium sp. AS2 TaxID=3135781 RepID=UPI00317D698C
MASPKDLAQRFPEDFLFGVATAAYQIEGAAAEDGRKPSIWDAFSKMPGRVFQRHSGDVACDHYHLWESDLDLIKSLGVDGYRFSIAWPRILPEGRGPVNEKGLDFYDRLIDGMIERGLKVYPTLYHWDLPLLLAGDGGWTARSTAEAFADYTDVVVRRLGDRMDALATVNEPWCICHLSHLYGIHAPGEKNAEAFAKAVHTLNLAHGLATRAARAVRPDLPMGIVINAHSIYPATQKPEDKAAADRAFLFHNDIFFSPVFQGTYHPEILSAYGDRMDIRDGDLETIGQPLDWWGLNYYTPMRVSHVPEAVDYPQARANPPEPGPELTDIGWEVHEKGLSDLLKELYARYRLPECYITENGACYNDALVDGIVSDQRRIDYLEQHFGAVLDARDAGVPVKGYFLWSLMDNFEWAEGYSMRFGIVHVDYDSQVRTPKASAHWYRDLVVAHKAPR